MANFYLITFDSDKVDRVTLHKVIKEANFMSWWHYISSSYVVKTDRSLSSVKDELLDKWPKQRFLIVKIDPHQYNGWLTPDAWAWFRKHKVDS